MKVPDYTPYLPDSYRVDINLLAGQHPVAVDWDETERRIYALMQAGTRTFIDLTVNKDGPTYGTTLTECAVNIGIDEMIRYMNVPIMNLSIPSVKDMLTILDFIDSELADGRGVYYHCYAGIGRTGTVTGCYLARRGMESNKRLEKIADLREDCYYCWAASPETPEQEEFVLAWPTGK